MYLDAAVLNHNRKERLCMECKGIIGLGEDNLMLMRRGRKGGRYYVYLHPCCILTMLWRERERRRVKEPRPAGRPEGSKLTELSPELLKERYRLIRARARVLRLLVAEEDNSKICELVARSRELKDRIAEILPLRIKKPGHRSAESVGILESKVDKADRIKRRKQAEQVVPQPSHPVEKSPEEIAEIAAQAKEILARAEAYRESGQVWTEDSRE